MRRVVVTGVGAVTPLAANLPETWKKLLAGQSGITTIPSELFTTTDLATKIAGIVPTGEEDWQFNASRFVSAVEKKRMDLFILYALAAGSEAIEDSDIMHYAQLNKDKFGVMVGSGIGGLQEIARNALILEQDGPRRISPFFIPSSLINLAAGHLSIKYGLTGPNHAVVTACATGTHAIGDAFKMVRHNEADVMLVASTESTVSRLGIAGFNACKALSTNYNEKPEKASRPWDKGRDGFVMGEGAGSLVLESYDHAVARGAKIYAEVVGYGMSGDAHHITAPAPNGEGAYKAMSRALAYANLQAADIDYINAHGTSTPLGDMIEVQAVEKIFAGQHKEIFMSSTKSATGHLLGAAGAIEAIFTIKSLETGSIPPTLNLDDPEDDLPKWINFVPHNARHKQPLKYAMSNSFGFGGTNATLCFKRMEYDSFHAD